MGKTREQCNQSSGTNLYVDITNNRVGIGTTIPTSALTVTGDARVAGIVTATTFSGNLSSGALTNYSETTNVVGNTGTAATINLANGNFVTATLTGNCTFTFTTGITSGTVSFTLLLTNDATPSRTITWPASVKWPGGTVPTRTTTASRTDAWTFFTTNNGTTWHGNIAQYNYA
jgi:hypothetical protein